MHEKRRTKNGTLGNTTSIIKGHFYGDPLSRTEWSNLIQRNKGMRLKIWPEITSDFRLVKKTSMLNQITCHTLSSTRHVESLVILSATTVKKSVSSERTRNHIRNQENPNFSTFLKLKLKFASDFLIKVPADESFWQSLKARFFQILIEKITENQGSQLFRITSGPHQSKPCASEDSR